MSKEIKKNKNVNPNEHEESVISKTEAFVENNQKQISYVVIGIIIIILAIMGYNKFIKQPKEKTAYEQMFMAEYYFGIDSLNLALIGDGNYPGFYDIVDDYKYTKAGNLAHYYIGMILMKQKNYEEAISHLKKFKSKDEILSAMANGAKGDAYVELGELDNALDSYLDAAENNPNMFVSPIFFAKAAWVYEQQQKYEKAIDLYKTIKKDFFRSFEGREADKNIAYLEAKKK